MNSSGEFYRRVALRLFAEFCYNESQSGAMVEYLTVFLHIASGGHLRKADELAAVNFFALGSAHTQLRLEREARDRRLGSARAREDHAALHHFCVEDGIYTQEWVRGAVVVRLTARALEVVANEFDAFAFELASDDIATRWPEIPIGLVGLA